MSDRPPRRDRPRAARAALAGCVGAGCSALGAAARWCLAARRRGARAGAAPAGAAWLTLFLTLRPGPVRRLHAADATPASAAPTGPAATATPARSARSDAHRRGRRRALPTGPVTARKAWIEMTAPLPRDWRRRADHRRSPRWRCARARRRAVGRSPCVGRWRRWSGSACRARSARYGDDEALSGDRHAAPARRHRPARAAGDPGRGATRRAARAVAGLRARRWLRRRRWLSCRSRSAAGSAPTTRCSPARDFPHLPGQLVAARWTSAEGFTLRAPARRDGGGGYLPFAALTAIHMAHRLGAARAAARRSRALAWRLRARGERRRAAGRSALARRWLPGSWPAGSATCCSAGRSRRRSRTPAAPRRWSSSC